MHITIIYKSIFTKERQIDGSLLKLITLTENTSGIYQTYCFSFNSVIAIFDTVFWYFVVTLIEAAFHAEMFLIVLIPYDE